MNKAQEAVRAELFKTQPKSLKNFFNKNTDKKLA